MRKIFEDLLIFVRERNFKAIKVAFTIIGLLLTAYGVLCSVYTDVIVQNNNSWVKLPYKSQSEKQVEVSFDELVNGDIYRHKSPQKNIYIFVLDISGSVRKKRLPPSMEGRYNEGIKFINKSVSTFQLNGNTKHPTVMDFAKVRLYELLIELRNNRGKSEDEYAIWTIGDQAILRFPKSPKSVPIRGSIEDAIKTINELPIGENKNTDFRDLFFRLSKVYKEELEQKQENEFENPFFVTTILSDLIHDVDKKIDTPDHKVAKQNNKIDRQEEIDKNWEELEELIQRISYSKIMANMIIFSDKGPNLQRTIFPLFRKNIDWYRLNKYLIGAERNKEFLYTVRTTEKNINFYYTNPHYINDTSFIIKSRSDNPNKIKIDIPSEINLVPIPKMSILCEVLGQNGNPLGENKRIVSGGSEFEFELKQDQKIRLVYNGRLPSDLSVPILRISIGNDCRTVLVPIIFTKRLSGWASIIFILFHSFIILALVVIVLGFVADLKEFIQFRNLKYAEQEADSPSENWRYPQEKR